MPTIQELISEQEKLINWHRNSLPTWVTSGKIKMSEAEHRMACLETTLSILQSKLATETPKPFPTNPLAKSVAELATPKQIVMIRAMCRDLDIDVDIELQETMKMECKVEELSRRAASSFIDHLKQLQEGNEIPIVRRAW